MTVQHGQSTFNDRNVHFLLYVPKHDKLMISQNLIDKVSLA